MKKFLSCITAGFIAFSIQAQDLPKPSPSAKVQQTVGLTNISITYSRPGVKGRTIWGDLVPYNELWRAGANKATLFSTDYAIQIGDEMLPEGDYSLFILPVKDGAWKVVWNKETELWGTGDYDDSKDALSIEVKPEDISGSTGRLEYHFTDVNMNSGVLAMDWAGKRISIPISADPKEQVMKNIETALAEAKDEDKWRVYRSAASYAENVEMTDQGLEWIKKSVELKESWYSYWIYCNLLGQSGDAKGAEKMGSKAIAMGKEGSDDFGYTERIQADIDRWKK